MVRARSEPPAARGRLPARLNSEQARKGGESEGYSIPAQRQFCEQKAAFLGAEVTAEFVDRGASAKTTDRRELQRMLAYLHEQPVELVIVHKLDRLSRSVLDNLTIWAALEQAGIGLVSCSEQIDNTPSGWLSFIFMSGIGEYHNRNLKTEVIKGMAQKARLGGIPGKAPLGYLNIHRSKGDQIIRTVKIDPERGPLLTWAFTAYATGEWPLRRLLDELTRRGLEIPATAKRTARPLSLSHLHRILSNPFYRQVVRFCGSEYPGRHKPLVDETTWRHVQDVLAAHRVAQNRQRTHDHPLKGSVYCGSCRSRLIITRAVGKTGGVYPYFICAGRHEKRTSCSFRATLIKRIEQQVVAEYANPDHQLTAEERTGIEASLTAELAAYHEDSAGEHKRLASRREGLLAERRKLLQAHLADAVPLDLLKSEQHRIREQLDSIERQLKQLAAPQELIQRNLRATLGLLTDARALYLALGARGRRALTQALFTRIEIIEESDAEAELAEPFQTLIGRRYRSAGLSNGHLVLLTGQLSNPPDRLRKALDLYRTWQSEQRPDGSRGARR